MNLIPRGNLFSPLIKLEKKYEHVRMENRG